MTAEFLLRRAASWMMLTAAPMAQQVQYAKEAGRHTVAEALCRTANARGKLNKGKRAWPKNVTTALHVLGYNRELCTHVIHSQTSRSEVTQLGLGQSLCAYPGMAASGLERSLTAAERYVDLVKRQVTGYAAAASVDSENDAGVLQPACVATDVFRSAQAEVFALMEGALGRFQRAHATQWAQFVARRAAAGSGGIDAGAPAPQSTGAPCPVRSAGVPCAAADAGRRVSVPAAPRWRAWRFWSSHDKTTGRRASCPTATGATAPAGGACPGVAESAGRKLAAGVISPAEYRHIMAMDRRITELSCIS